MTENIMKLLSKMASTQEEINLLNTYKGVPLTFSARILNVGFASIRVITDTFQSVSMCLDRKTYLQSSKFDEIYRADVESMSKADMITVLGNLANVNYGIGKRSEVRVQPAENITVNVRDQSGGYNLNGLVTDISHDGIGLYIGWRSFLPQLFFAGSPLVLTYQLPGVYLRSQTKPIGSQATGPLDRFSSEKTRFSTTTSRDFRPTGTGNLGRDGQAPGQILNPVMQVPAEVANVCQDPVFNRYRIGLRVLNNNLQQQYILKYLAQRQSEIIQEIRERYSMMRKDAGNGAGLINSWAQ
jgi:hypothetical protein